MKGIKLILLVFAFCFPLLAGGTCLASDTVEVSKQDLQIWKDSLKTLKTNNEFLRNALNESNPALAKASEQLAQSEAKLVASEAKCQELEQLLTEYAKEAKIASAESKKMTGQLQQANLYLQELKKQTDKEIKKAKIERDILGIVAIYFAFKK